jgi:hypothetical protein
MGDTIVTEFFLTVNYWGNSPADTLTEKPLPGNNFVKQNAGFKSRVLRTVPQTDTGELVEYTKALERTTLKELGKLTP